jgi:hypothetical protein
MRAPACLGRDGGDAVDERQQRGAGLGQERAPAHAPDRPHHQRPAEHLRSSFPPPSTTATKSYR